MNEITIQDNLLIWTFKFDPIDITVKYGSKVLSMYWSDELGISIDDLEDDNFLTNDVIQTEFLIPTNSIFYDLCRKTIPTNNTIFSDIKPIDSKKRVEFQQEKEGMKIQIDSDYKTEFDLISSAVTFYGSNGGSVQELGYKDKFVKLLGGIISLATNYKENQDDSHLVLKKKIE